MSSGVSRLAFVVGALAGLLVAGLGFTLVPRLQLGALLSIPLEMAFMGVALWITTRVWARSATGAPLDSPPGDADRRGEE